jgi:hypothetical protein
LLHEHISAIPHRFFILESHDLFQPPLLFFNQDPRIYRLGANGTHVPPCGLVVVGLTHLLAVRAPDDKRLFFFGFWHGIDSIGLIEVANI